MKPAARRIAWDARELATTFSALVGTAWRYYRDDPVMRAKMDALLNELHAEFGWKSRFFSTVGSWYVMPKIRREEKRLAEGWTYEPPTFHERNEHCTDRPELPECRSCEPLNRPAEPTAPKPPRASFRKPAATSEPSNSALVG